MVDQIDEVRRGSRQKEKYEQRHGIVNLHGLGEKVNYFRVVIRRLYRQRGVQ